MTSSCAGEIGLREPGEHTSGPNLASRYNVAHNPTLYTILETPPPATLLRYQMVTCGSGGQLFRPPDAATAVVRFRGTGRYGTSQPPPNVIRA
jgi:hypothetical protein